MRESMEIYPRTAAELAMKLQEVLLRATSGKIKWWEAAELIGISERQMRRWRKRFEEQGHEGLLDRRQRKPSSRRVPKAQAEQVRAVAIERVGTRIGAVPPGVMTDLDEALRLHLAL